MRVLIALFAVICYVAAATSVAETYLGVLSGNPLFAASSLDKGMCTPSNPATSFGFVSFHSDADCVTPSNYEVDCYMMQTALDGDGTQPAGNPFCAGLFTPQTGLGLLSFGFPAVAVTALFPSNGGDGTSGYYTNCMSYQCMKIVDGVYIYANCSGSPTITARDMTSYNDGANIMWYDYLATKATANCTTLPATPTVVNYWNATRSPDICTPPSPGSNGNTGTSDLFYNKYPGTVITCNGTGGTVIQQFFFAKGPGCTKPANNETVFAEGECEGPQQVYFYGLDDARRNYPNTGAGWGLIGAPVPAAWTEGTPQWVPTIGTSCVGNNLTLANSIVQQPGYTSIEFRTMRVYAYCRNSAVSVFASALLVVAALAFSM